MAGSFSAVSKRNFARKYSFDSIFQALQDLHTSAPLQSQNFRKKSVWKISNFCENSAKFLQMSQNLQIFAKFQKFQLDNLVDFEKCCKTRIFLQWSAPIQPKTTEFLPKIYQRLATTLRVRRALRPRKPGRAVVANFWQIFGKISLVFGCIGADLCK